MKFFIKINGHTFECFTKIVGSYSLEEGDQFEYEDIVHRTFDGLYKFTVSEALNILQLIVHDSNGEIVSTMRLSAGDERISLYKTEMPKSYYTVLTVPKELKIYFEQERKNNNETFNQN